MEFSFKSDVKASDLWNMAMRRTYRSIIGIVNIVFTIAMLALTFRYFNTVSPLLKRLLILGCILFPLIQPLCTYGMCVKQLEDLPKDMTLSFNDKGMHVETSGKTEDLKWKKIVNAIKRSNMIIIMSDDRHGYMLTNRVLGDDKERFYDFLCGKIRG